MADSRLVVLGAGGHARVVIEILEELGGWDIVGCLAPEPMVREVLGYPVLGGDDRLAELIQAGVRSAIVAVGDNRLRRKIAQRALELGVELVTAVSPSAKVSSRATLGEGVVVAPGAVINTGARLGDGVIVNTGATVDHGCQVGPYAHIAPGCHLAGDVLVGEGSLLGIGACVLPRIRIGSWAVVGAGAVVHRDVPEASTVVGVPARLLSRKAEG